MAKKRNVFRKSLLVLGLVGAASLHVFDFNELSAVKTALAQPESDQAQSCPLGSTCVIYAGGDGGCKDRKCCPGQTYCGSDELVGFPFPAYRQLKKGEKGQCRKPDNAEKTWCQETECIGGGPLELCNSECQGNGEVNEKKRNLTVSTGITCPVEAL